MKKQVVALLILTLLFVGCAKPNYYGNSLILAQKSPCVTCQVDLKKYK